MSSAEYDTVANSGNNTVVATVDDISNHNTIPTRDDAAVFSTKSELVDNTHTTSKNGVHNSVSNSSHSFDPKAVKYDRKNSALHKYYANTSKKSIQLAWEDINFSILGKNAKASTFFKPVKKVQHILRNSSGAVKSGELLAIMGPTGCGKTSLLNVLAARVAANGSSNMKLTGKILFNGKDRNDASFRKVTGYVQQDDLLFAHLTVYETLLLASHFFLRSTVSDPDKALLVDDVISELGLVKVRNTIVGNESRRGVSGGEKKRLNIGVQLISNPLVLFLDEPTTGLDSFQAQAVMENMKALADSGRIVVSVIHQPRSSIFEMFDKLLLLSEGQTIYLGDALGASDYFTKAGFGNPKFFNPSDFFLDILSPDNRTPESEKETHSRIEYLANYWENERRSLNIHGKEAAEEIDYSREGKTDDHAQVSATRPIAEIENIDPIEGEEKIHRRDSKSSESGTYNYSACMSSLAQFDFKQEAKVFQLLMWRAWIEQSRNIPALTIRFVTTIFFAGIIGGIYSETENNQDGIRNIQGFFFITALNQGFNSASSSAGAFIKEKVIVNREFANNAYFSLTYFIAKFFVELPLNLAPCVVFGIIAYFSAGLEYKRYGIYQLIVMLESITAVSLGLVAGSYSESAASASSFALSLIIINFIFGGFYINLRSLPIVANWFPYVSMIRWSFEAMCINEFKDQTYDCSGNAQGTGCLSTGEQVLDSLDFGDQTSDAVFGLSMVFIGYLVIAYLILLLKVVTYLPLGFVGRKQVLYQKQLEFTSDDKNMERELVPTADNDAVDNGKVASLDTNHHENI